MKKILVDSQESYELLLRKARQMLVERQVQLTDGALFNLYGSYYRDELGTIPSVTIQLAFEPTEEDREYLVILRAEIYKVLSHLSASQVCLGMTKNDFRPVYFGMNYLGVVIPTDMYSQESFDMTIEGMDCPGMAQMAIGCYLNTQKLMARAFKKADITFHPLIKSLKYYTRDAKHPKKVVVIVETDLWTTLTIEDFKKMVLQTYFNSKFIRQTLSRYKYVIVRK